MYYNCYNTVILNYYIERQEYINTPPIQYVPDSSIVSKIYYINNNINN